MLAWLPQSSESDHSSSFRPDDILSAAGTDFVSLPPAAGNGNRPEACKSGHPPACTELNARSARNTRGRASAPNQAQSAFTHHPSPRAQSPPLPRRRPADPAQRTTPCLTRSQSRRNSSSHPQPKHSIRYVPVGQPRRWVRAIKVRFRRLLPIQLRPRRATSPGKPRKDTQACRPPAQGRVSKGLLRRQQQQQQQTHPLYLWRKKSLHLQQHPLLQWRRRLFPPIRQPTYRHPQIRTRLRPSRPSQSSRIAAPAPSKPPPSQTTRTTLQSPSSIPSSHPPTPPSSARKH